MRLFTAIDLTPAARAAIATEQQALTAQIDEGGRGVRWVRPEHLHVTLTFMPDVPETQAADLTRSLSAPIELSSFRMVFRGIGTFPERGAPRVLWLGITEGVEEAQSLKDLVAQQMNAVGVIPESKPFNPHLTLGRWRDGRRSDGRRRAPASREAIAAMEVEAVTLFESRLSSTGPTYTVLARAPLRCR